ncbi:acyltransferase family protein [Rathayibacter agropyri]|uniref:acyltransferase family protein n=1 Tax=Rathayibacter agropyri TaxID=1634927 RepID=UPI0031B5E68E
MGLDAVRIVGFVAIVAGHVWTTEESRWLVYPWHVPLYFMLSGRLWTRKREFGPDVRTRLRTLLLPYVSWLLIIGALLAASLVARGWPFTADGVYRFLLGGSYLGRPFSAFWFVTCLFTAGVVLRLLQRFPLWVPTAIAVVGLVVAYISPEVVAAVPWAAGTAIPALIFVLAGYGLKVWSPRRPVLVGVTALMVGIILVATRLAEPVNIKSSEFGTPVLSVVAAICISGGLILLGEKAFERAGERVSKAVTMLAAAGLVVILTHAAVLSALRIDPIIVFAAALVLPWLLGLVLLRIPGTRFLTGARA